MDNSKKSFFGAAVKASGDGIEPTARQAALQGRKQLVPEKQDSDPEMEAELSVRMDKVLNGESVDASALQIRPVGTRSRNRALSELVTDHTYLFGSATSSRAREAGDAPATSKGVQSRAQKATSPAPPPDARAPFGKNSRKSRTGRRGLVKKGLLVFFSSHLICFYHHI